MTSLNVSLQFQQKWLKVSFTFIWVQLIQHWTKDKSVTHWLFILTEETFIKYDYEVENVNMRMHLNR